MNIILRVVLALLVGALLVWFAQPAWGVCYPSTWFVLLVLIAIVFVPVEDGDTVGFRMLLWGGLCVLVLVVATASTWGAFHAQAYQAQLGPEDDKAFTASLPPIDVHQPPLVSSDMARRSAEKRLSERQALGSQVDIGDFQKQLVDGKLYWVAFLQHRTLTRWWNAGTTPGYVKVSAVDPTDVALVTDVGAQPLAMRYLPSAYLGDNLDRHLYWNGFAGYDTSHYTPEIDDTGRPYYVVSLVVPGVGMAGSEVVGVATVDVQTGAIARYALTDVPAWVDIVQPDDIVAAQVANRGEFVHGWFNPSDRDRLRPSGEPDLIYGTDGRAYWYLGMTSTGNDAGLVGFYLIDSRTKAVRNFQLAGITEKGAQHAALGVMPEKNYAATSPLPFLVNGQPTYAMALRDGTGIPRAYALVNIQSYQTLAVADTLQAALRQYETLLSRSRTATDASATTSRTRFTGRLLRVGATVRQGNTFYYLTLDSVPRKLFVAGNDLSEVLPLAAGGDEAVLDVEGATDASVLTVVGFEDKAVLPATP